MANLSDYMPAGILGSTTPSPTSASVGDILGRVPAPLSGTSTPPAAAYGDSSASAAPDPLAALKQLNQSLADQSALDANDQATQLSVEQQRAQLAESTKQQALTINDQSRAAAAGYRQQQLGLLSSVSGVVAKGQRAMQLSDSQNPMDRLQLWLLQHSDPEYTKVGNTARLSYLTDAAQAIGVQDAVVQQAYTDQLGHIQDMNALKDQQLTDTETLAHVKAQVGQARIDSYVDAMKARANLLASQNQMQDGVIANLDGPATQMNLQKALASPNKTINIGGVDISAAALQDRADALATRDYNMQFSRLQAEKVTLSDMDMGQVQAAQAEAAKNGYAMVNGVQISPAQLTARQQEIVQGQASGVTNSLTIAQAREGLDQMNQKQLLPTYNLTELNRIQLNGGKDPQTGKLFDPGLLAQAITARKDALQNQTAMQVGAASVGDPVQAAKDSTDYLNGIKAPPGSPLAALIAKQRLIVQAAAGSVDRTDTASLASYGDILSGVRNNVDKGVAAQAQAMSMGNKDLEAAYTYQLRGQLIPDAVLGDALVSQIQAGKPVNQWLDPNLASTFTQAYTAALNASGQVGATGTMPADLATRKQAAAQEALKAVKAQAAGPITDMVMGYQVSDPANPLNQAGMQPNRIVAIIHNADQVYGDKYLDQSNYSDADKAAIRAGTKQDPGYAAAQAGGLIMDLNKIKPGLGDSYVNYWGSQARDNMVQGFVNGQGASAAGAGLQSLSGSSLALPDVAANMDVYSQILQSGQDMLHEKQFADEHANYVSFGADPSLKQVFLLQSTPGLSDNQRQDAYQLLISPILDEVKAQNMNTQQASAYIENRLRNLQPDTPQQKALLKAVLAGRNDALNAGDNLTKLLPAMNQYHLNFMPFSGDPSNAILDRVDAHYGWWQALQKNRGQ